MKNDVWDVVPRPHGKFVVTSKWTYKIKHEVDGSSRNPPQCIPIPKGSIPQGIIPGHTRWLGTT